MQDSDAIFAAVLARSVGRLDWWNVYAEHTDFEWAMQMLMYQVYPFGERRADLRSGFHTANLIASQSAERISEGDFRDMIESLAAYLPCDQDLEEDVDFAALNSLKGDN